MEETNTVLPAALQGMQLSTGSLFAQLLWGGIASGYLIYGWKQKSVPALVGGAVMTGVCFYNPPWVWLSLASVGIMVGIYFWAKNN